MAELPGISIDEKTFDNRVFVQASPRPLGTVATFTSEGDSTLSPIAVGDGQSMKIDHLIGDPVDQEISVDLNVKENKTFITGGHAIWSGAQFDSICLGIYPRTTDYTTASGTYFNLYGGYMVVPAAGDGNINLTSAPQLVEIPVSIDNGLRSSPAFWNAPYDTQTHSFGDLTACPNGDGTYNIFTQEVCLGTFVRNVSLVGEGHMEFRTNDAKEIGHNMRLKIACHTDSSADHEWRGGFGLMLFRQQI